MNFDQRLYELLQVRVDEGLLRKVGIGALKVAPVVGRGVEKVVHGAANIAKDTYKGFDAGATKQLKRAGAWAGRKIKKGYSTLKGTVGTALAAKRKEMENTETRERAQKNPG